MLNSPADVTTCMKHCLPGKLTGLTVLLRACHICTCCPSVTQSCPTLCDPVDCSPPGSSVHGILQARILEWVAVPSSRGSSQPRNTNPCLLCLLHCRQVLYPLSHLGSPLHVDYLHFSIHVFIGFIFLLTKQNLLFLICFSVCFFFY